MEREGFSRAIRRAIRVAVIDSGVHADHPHVGGVAGGIAFDADGREHADYVDRLGHGTAVTAAIRDLAPAADLVAIKVFDRSLSTRIGSLVSALEWAARHEIDIANLSLGTPRAEHEPALGAAIETAAAHRMIIVAARDDEGVRYLPGSLPGVVPVQVDWALARHQYRIVEVDGAAVVRASGLPREIPGVPPSKNLRGVSFAVANATAFVARALAEGCEPTVGAALECLSRSRDTVVR